MKKYVEVSSAEHFLDKGWSIDEVPPADVAPVVHAKWIVDRYCSNCEFDNHKTCCETTKYCPDCGAKMDAGEEKDNEN